MKEPNMKKFRWSLERYSGPSSRHICPNCRTAGEFTRYVDNVTGKHFASDIGKCNRENKCGYHLPPQPGTFCSTISFDRDHLSLLNAFSTIPTASLLESIVHFKQNAFYNFLSSKIGADNMNGLCYKYYLGSSGRWDGANVFWQVDVNGKIRTGKVMLYNHSTGRRIKDPKDHISWAHTSISKFQLKQCFFGEHLLKNTTRTIGLVESEKTAVVCSHFFPDYIWLAAGGISNLNGEKCKVLANRDVILYPDLGAEEKWLTKAKQHMTGCRYTVSDWLTKAASQADRREGLDLADYLLL